MNNAAHSLSRQGTVFRGAFDHGAPAIAPGLRPPLKWAGGKRWLVPHFCELWSRHTFRRLVEPFAGGMAITLGLLPEQALLNDINRHLINFYRWIKQGLTIDFTMWNSRTFYELARARFNRLTALRRPDTREAAALFFYLNRTGYNGLCRFNRGGTFNVPFGQHERIEYTRRFCSYRDVFQKWAFLDGDFEEVPLEPSDFVYADPPYDAAFTSYAENGFSWVDQVRAAEWLARHRGPVVLSNQATPRIVTLYRKLGFMFRFVDARRSISCNGDRTPVTEILAMKNI